MRTQGSSALCRPGSSVLPIVATFAFALTFATSALRAQSAEVCDPPAAVKAALDQLPQQTPADTDWQFHKQRLAAIRSLLGQYPDDVFVQRAYIEARRSFADRSQVISEYKARHEKNPDDARLDYLYGYALVGRDSSQAVDLFKAALAKDLAFGRPHLELVSIYSSPAFLNKAESLTHLRAFLQACPSSFDGYDALPRSDDQDLIRQGAQRLRALVEKRSDLDAVNAYQTVWSLEFKAHPASEYGPLRQQVKADLGRIRALNLQNKREWWETLEDGYKLANDQQQADWAKDQRQARFPYPWELAAMSKWEDDHHYPGQDAPAEQRHAYFTELLAQSVQWVKERPNDVYILMNRLDAMEHLDNVPAAEVEAEAEKEVRVAEINAGPQGLDSDSYFNAAEVLAKKHLEPERVLELARKGLAKWDSESKQPPFSDLYATKDNLADQKFYQAYSRSNGMEFEIAASIELKQPQQAQLELQQLDEQLQDVKSLAGDKQDRKQGYADQLTGYWWLMARDAELQGRKLDAMAFYENALLTRLDAKIKPETGVKDELADNARELWTSLGGSKEGWTTWYARPAEALANQATLTWNDANDPLPSFDLTDLNGKTWNLAALKGKTVFLNFWASW
jgi:hypothetical protein